MAKTPYISKSFSNQNFMINGNFDFWQRGTSFATLSGYSADRWQSLTSGSGVATVSRSTDVPTAAESGFQSEYSFDVDVTTADASATGGDYYSFGMLLEGKDFQPLHEQVVTFSFWVKATKTGINTIALQSGAGVRTYLAEYTVNVSNTWEKKTVSLLMDVVSTNFDTGVGLKIYWNLAIGTTFAGSPGSWQNVTYLGSTNQVNNMDNVSNIFRIAQVKLELGGQATGFSRRGDSIAGELALCQRYYEKSYSLNTALGTVTGTDASTHTAMANNATVTANNIVGPRYRVDKRTSPTITIYSVNTGTINQLTYARHGAAGADVAASVNFVGEKSFRIYTASASGMTAGDAIELLYHYVANAEL